MEASQYCLIYLAIRIENVSYENYFGAALSNNSPNRSAELNYEYLSTEFLPGDAVPDFDSACNQQVSETPKDQVPLF
jgi:hypothetical protein